MHRIMTLLAVAMAVPACRTVTVETEIDAYERNAIASLSAELQGSLDANITDAEVTAVEGCIHTQPHARRSCYGPGSIGNVGRCRALFAATITPLVDEELRRRGYLADQGSGDLRWPLHYRKTASHAAWSGNQWAEVHDVLVSVYPSSKPWSLGRLVISYQALAGPQPFEREMQDVSLSDSAKSYFSGLLHEVSRGLEGAVSMYCDPFRVSALSDDWSSIHHILVGIIEYDERDTRLAENRSLVIPKKTAKFRSCVENEMFMLRESFGRSGQPGVTQPIHEAVLSQGFAQSGDPRNDSFGQESYVSTQRIVNESEVVHFLDVTIAGSSSALGWLALNFAAKRCPTKSKACLFVEGDDSSVVALYPQLWIKLSRLIRDTIMAECGRLESE